jgi:hypothetical protein
MLGLTMPDRIKLIRHWQAGFKNLRLENIASYK